MQIRNSILLAGSAAALLACATPPPPLLSAPHPPILADREAFTREADLAPSREVVLEGMGIRFRVPALADVEIRREDDAQRIYFDIGTEAPIMCEVHAGQLQLANYVYYRATPLSDEPQPNKLVRWAPKIGSGAEAGHAFLTLHWVYSVDGRFGAVKQAAANAYGHTIYCQHREPGYEQTFSQAFRTLLATFTTRHVGEPYYSEVTEVRVGGHLIGIESVEMRQRRDGDTRIDFNQSLLLPQGPGKIAPSDTREVSFSTEEGTLIQQNSIEVLRGRLALRLVLQEASQGTWRVSGIHERREFTAEFHTEGALRSRLGSSQDIRGGIIRDGNDAHVTYQQWLPDLDPSRVSKVATQLTGLRDDGFYTAVRTLGGVRADVVLDRDGSVVSTARPIGPASLTKTRVYVAGIY
jgi:hypothetical protein